MINRKTIIAFLTVGVALAAIFIVVAVAPGSYVLAQDSESTPDVIPVQPAFDVRSVAAPLINDAMGLQFGASDIEVVGASQINWPDTCLGLPVSGMPPFEPDLCEQSAVPGYRIVVTALDGTYVIHTNRDGSEARLLPPTISLGEGGAQAGVPVTGDEQQQATGTQAPDQQATATVAGDQTATLEATGTPAAADQTATPAETATVEATTPAATEAPADTATVEPTEPAATATVEPTEPAATATVEATEPAATESPAAGDQTATPQVPVTGEQTGTPAATESPAAAETATPAAEETATPAATGTPAAGETGTPAAGDQTATPQVPVTGDQQQVVPGVGLPSIPGEPNFNVAAAIIPALNDISGLNYSADDIRVASVQRINFPDDCLGLAVQGLPPFEPDACAAEATAGYRIGVVAIDSFYVVHTNDTGSEVRVVPPTITAGSAGGVPVTGEEGQPAGAYSGMLNLFRPEAIPAQPSWNVLAAAISFLSDELDLQLNREVVEITSVQQVNWSDACLGLAGIDGGGVSCAPISTPGYRIVANVIDGPYVIHTNADGSDMRLFPPGLTAGQSQQAGGDQEGQ